MDSKDEDILHKMHEKLDIGSISYQGDMCDLAIQSDTDCQKVVEYVEDNKGNDWELTHKATVFDKWKEAVQMKSNSGNLTPEEKEEMIRLSCDLNQTDRGKSVDEWLDILSDLYDNYDRNI